ncbi:MULTISPECIES: LPS export ABC transporter periplasmic protein LptC [Vibrio]|uniref:Lipopolysaccharide export system protein LptC n=1 Tax=Vibrio proteolyticus NBRC 13287 TaxID=1219065 RepID=U2ZFG5_VIBPR|nr:MULTISPECIES: LPS export ABC transporter periplasmic protein LptC [Vibrio]NAW56039.1 LPS export ABC transporter periplasmic protein LptC [Vibrio sp. V36_P2S2PM302]NAX22127.1 LPS export ABC transporter periplasmic protein LptC [Vibrio sp. V39_P1S14PM300]NAX26027.1 LPS export ABC transporter periplasmic protein LptC [Vibrio sp. V38_P2S17PM301]NAX29185.1 LPS export ABC transporter periplasmic protein LptC [Vibrio sp. V37_P2S8PM304]GAD66431.1 lipopolysaccharide ABC transporter substrate-binding
MSLSRIIYVLLFIVAGVSIYYLLDKENTFDIQVEPNVELPMFSGESVTSTSYDESGTRSYVITSTHLDHYAQSGDTLFEKPVLKVFNQGTIQEWEVTADSAVLDKDHVLTLHDNVLAKNLLPDSGFDTLSTAKMSIQLDNRDFWADNQVVLIGPQFETVGQAMKGNFADNTAVLYNHVQGRYETLTP